MLASLAYMSPTRHITALPGNSQGAPCTGDNYTPIISLFNSSQSDMRVLGPVLGGAGNCQGPGLSQSKSDQSHSQLMLIFCSSLCGPRSCMHL